MAQDKTIFSCTKCGATYNGKSNVCELCGGKARQQGERKPSTASLARVDPSDQRNCAKCGIPCGSMPTIIYDGKRYHQQCFVCDSCNQPIEAEKEFSLKDDGRMICGRCTVFPVCAGCHKKMTGTITHANGKQYHPDCFKCEECNTKLVGGYAKVGDRCVCKACATKLSGQKSSGGPGQKISGGPGGKSAEAPACVRCGKAVTGRFIRADKGDAFHPECFTCAFCNDPLKSYVRDENRKFTYQKALYVCPCCAPLLQQTEDQFSPCSICGSKYPLGTFWCIKCQAPTYKVDESNKVCSICKQDIDGPGVLRSVDGSVFHQACFKCTVCGKTKLDDTEANARLAQVHLDLAKDGRYKCNTCYEAWQKGKRRD